MIVIATEWVILRWSEGSAALTGWGLFLGVLIFMHFGGKSR